MALATTTLPVPLELRFKLAFAVTVESVEPVSLESSTFSVPVRFTVDVAKARIALVIVTLELVVKALASETTPVPFAASAKSVLRVTTDKELASNCKLSTRALPAVAMPVVVRLSALKFAAADADAILPFENVKSAIVVPVKNVDAAVFAVTLFAVRFPVVVRFSLSISMVPLELVILLVDPSTRKLPTVRVPVVDRFSLEKLIAPVESVTAPPTRFRVPTCSSVNQPLRKRNSVVPMEIVESITGRRGSVSCT